MIKILSRTGFLLFIHMFSSLGGLVPGLSLEAILMGVSESRNPNLAAVFYRMNIVESYGTGIDKIMDLYGDYPVKPQFKTAEGAFQVILHNMNDIGADTSVSENPEKPMSKAVNKDVLMNRIRNAGMITRKETETILGIGTTAACTVLKELTEEGRIRPVGPGKTRHYVIA